MRFSVIRMACTAVWRRYDQTVGETIRGLIGVFRFTCKNDRGRHPPNGARVRNDTVKQCFVGFLSENDRVFFPDDTPPQKVLELRQVYSDTAI